MAWKDNYDELQVTALNINEGDYLPGISNGYVVEVEENNGYTSYPNDRYNAAVPSDTIIVTFHNEQGDEGYLLLPPDTRVTVLREK
jgi:hypothetical protein